VVQPAADVTIDETLVRGLLAEQHPDLAGLPLQRFDAGWDNDLWRLGDELAVRLPRRAMGAFLTVHEHRWLPVLGPRLPLPVPVPLRFGVPSDGFPWPWSVVPWIEGRAGDAAPIVDGPAGAAALALFLRALHVPAPPEAPVHPFGRGLPLDGQQARFDELLATPAGDVVDRAAVRAVWDAGVAAGPFDAEPLWLHADLHAANTLTRDGTLAGVLDFGDLCQGDPAIDLASAWMLLPDLAAIETFLHEYGHVDADTHARAKAWAVRNGLMILDIGIAGRRGLPGGKPTWERPGLRAIEHALSA
jgi:aminoglycoside phosphotransferase (APT) family kinase protein